MAQKERVAREIRDKEFDEAMEVILKEDGVLLKMLAKV
jgi:hypothetical protein